MTIKCEIVKCKNTATKKSNGIQLCEKCYIESNQELEMINGKKKCEIKECEKLATKETAGISFCGQHHKKITNFVKNI